MRSLPLFDILSGWFSSLPRITLTGFFEIAIIAFLVYKILIWIRNTRAWVLLRGLIMIFAFTLFAAFFHLDTILWIMGRIATVAVTALVIIFQPELRRALEQLGNGSIMTTLFLPEGKAENKFSEKTISEICKASFELSKTKTGALIVIEREISLKEIERTGINIDGVVTSQLLINIFEHNTPLHDGAVIVRGDKIVAATCYLPLSDNMQISKDLGTRHRAAIGISEVTDSVTVVVSEETGRVSLAQQGILRQINGADKLKKVLEELPHATGKISRLGFWKGRIKHARKTD